MLTVLFSAVVLIFAGRSKALPAAATCRDVAFIVTAAADNAVFANPPDPKNETALVECASSVPVFNGTAHVTGTYLIRGHYCAPAFGHDSHGDHLQFLIHGNSYNRTTWTGLGFGDQYNYHAFAASRGYHTLAIDIYGRGESRPSPAPDPITVLQAPLHAAIIHEIITLVRNSPWNPLLRTFSTVSVLGHSYGSNLAMELINNYPHDADVIIPTAFSMRPAAPDWLVGSLVSAARLFPSRMGTLPLGYLTIGTETVRTNAFYLAGAFNPAIAEADFFGSDTLAVAELVVLAEGLTPTTEFTGAVLIVTGQQDAILCNSVSVANGTCDQLLDATNNFLFPAARALGYYAPPQTGHDWMLHYSAENTMVVIHDWLDKVLKK